jgi:hypothetical protein
MKEQDEVAPPPAEAATEVGYEEEDLGSDFISDVAIAILVLAVIAAIVIKAVGLV